MPSANQHPQPKPVPETSSASVFRRMPLEDVLEDLASRFILNIPSLELSQIERVCFAVEQAHWFYEDFIRPNSLIRLPCYNLKTFTKLFFEKCHFLTIQGAPLYGWDHQTAYDKFLRYKERVPVCGAIILNSDASKVLLVKGFRANSSWSFPRGKINQTEEPRDCAIREVLEETGFDITPHMALPSSIWGSNSKLSAIQKGRPSNPTPSGHNTSNERYSKHSMLYSDGDDHFIEITVREQQLRMYLVTGVPDNTVFETQTRQEISAIAWFPLTDLPSFASDNTILMKRPTPQPSSIPPQHEPDAHGLRGSFKFYMVIPFMSDLRLWLVNYDLICLADYGLTHKTESPLPYQHSPPHLMRLTPDDHSNSILNGTKSRYAFYPGSLTNTDDFEAAAVHERARRLQTFQFDDQLSQLDDELVPSSPPPELKPEVRIITKKKKKKTLRKKSTDPVKFLIPAIPTASITANANVTAGSVYANEQQLVRSGTTTEDEGENLAEAKWNGIEEGPTRAVQGLFFGGGAKPNGSDRDAGNSNQFLKQTERHRPRNQLPSDADTDVVKGYDIATSYASSMSSSYREPSTQIPSSDEYTASPLGQGSATLLSQLLNPAAFDLLTEPPPTDIRHPSQFQMNEAEALYSKHGHLAAPRPQPAPQQVERLLAMLQAPTPGPPPISYHEQTPSGVSNINQNGYVSVHHELVNLGGSDSDLYEQKTPSYRDHQSFIDHNTVTTTSTTTFEISQAILASPESGRTILQQSLNSNELSPPITTTSATAAATSRAVETVMPITPRASNLLDLLVKGTTTHSSSSVTHQVPSRSPSGRAVPPFSAVEPPGCLKGTLHNGKSSSSLSSRIPLKESERREKQDALLRQLQALASAAAAADNGTSNKLSRTNGHRSSIGNGLMID